MNEQAPPPDPERSEAPTGSWEVVPPADHPAPVETAAPVEHPVDAAAPIEHPVDAAASVEAVAPAELADEPPTEVAVEPPVEVVEAPVDAVLQGSPLDPPPIPPVSPSAAPAATASDRPEIVIGGALAGGFILALILKRLAR